MKSETERYLSLLKKSLLNELYMESEVRIAYLALHLLTGQIPPLEQLRSEFLRIRESDLFPLVESGRLNGGNLVMQKRNECGDLVPFPEMLDFVFTPHTMIGRKRLDHLHECLDVIVRDRIPGDVIETGVWKGGATIFMRAYFAIHKIEDRRVWVADSFQGLPKPTHHKDEGWDLSAEARPYLSVSLEEVQDLFRRYDLLDDQVCFLKGWFSETLPTAPIDRLAILRLDGDLYESTMDALHSLYSKVSTGGFIIVDDYDALPQCRDAIHDFRTANGIDEEIVRVDEVSVFWRKTGFVNSQASRPRVEPATGDADQYSVRHLLKLLFTGRQ